MLVWPDRPKNLRQNEINKANNDFKREHLAFVVGTMVSSALFVYAISLLSQPR